MKVIDLVEAKTHLEDYVRECHATPIVVTIDGRPAFEMLPIRSDAPDFIDRLLTTNSEFRQLMESRYKESEEGRVSSLAAVRDGFAR